MTDRITIRLGSLTEPLAAACAQSGRSPIMEIRARLAESFGVDEPEMRQGFAALSSEQAKRLQIKSVRVRMKNAKQIK